MHRHWEGEVMRLTTVLLLALVLAGCGGVSQHTSQPVTATSDEGDLMWAYMAPLDSIAPVPVFRDAGRSWWGPGMPLTSERRDGTNELIFAVMDSHGQFLPKCPPCPCPCEKE